MYGGPLCQLVLKGQGKVTQLGGTNAPLKGQGKVTQLGGTNVLKGQGKVTQLVPISSKRSG